MFSRYLIASPLTKDDHPTLFAFVDAHLISPTSLYIIISLSIGCICLPSLCIVMYVHYNILSIISILL